MRIKPLFVWVVICLVGCSDSEDIPTNPNQDPASDNKAPTVPVVPEPKPDDPSATDPVPSDPSTPVPVPDDPSTPVPVPDDSSTDVLPPLPQGPCVADHRDGDTYEPDECFTRAHALEVGVEHNASIFPTGDQDYFSLRAKKNDIIEIKETGGLDTFFSVYNRDFTFLMSTDEETLRYVSPRDDFYYVRITSESTGPYRLLLNNLGPDNSGNNAETAQPITLGQTIAGNFEMPGDWDCFSITVQPNHVFAFEATSSTALTHDLVYDGQSDAESGGKRRWKNASSTEKNVAFCIRPYSSTSIGTYNLSVIDLGEDDHGDNVSHATLVVSPETRQGTFEYPEDWDCFSIAVQPNHVIAFEATSSMALTHDLVYDGQNHAESGGKRRWTNTTNADKNVAFCVQPYYSASIGTYILTVVGS